MKYRKKPVVIEAIQFDGSKDSANEVLAWIGHYGHEARKTNGGVIIKGVKDEFYPCKPDIFAATYEAAE